MAHGGDSGSRSALAWSIDEAATKSTGGASGTRWGADGTRWGSGGLERPPVDADRSRKSAGDRIEARVGSGRVAEESVDGPSAFGRLCGANINEQNANGRLSGANICEQSAYKRRTSVNKARTDGSPRGNAFHSLHRFIALHGVGRGCVCDATNRMAASIDRKRSDPEPPEGGTPTKRRRGWIGGFEYVTSGTARK